MGRYVRRKREQAAGIERAEKMGRKYVSRKETGKRVIFEKIIIII